MALGMIVQIPVTGAFGTDDDFDLRTHLERELDAALSAEQAGECGRGETEDGRMSVYLEGIEDAAIAFRTLKNVLTHFEQLHRAVILLETRCEVDPDDIDRRTLWPVHHPSPACVV